VVRIALDAMGGDGAPRVLVEGALSALEEWPDRYRISLVGVADQVNAELPSEVRNAIDVVPASQVVEMHEAPVRAVRRKRDSSIVVGLRLLRNGQADAFISAGSTGAVMAASRFMLGMLPGVERPTVGTVFPTAGAPTLVLDAGANVDSRPSQLLQFAHLGTVYMRDVADLERPRVGLLNVGEEPGKGDERAVATHRLLRADTEINFIGNVEGHRIIEGACDVLVCDGFAGNVLLKFYESIAGFVTGLLEEKLNPEACGDGLREVHRALDYTEHGGAPLLGVNGVSVVCHGASPPNAIKNAIRVAGSCVESGMVEDMAADLGSMSRTARVWRRIRRR
jgi:glycerol-3-phosphate acyltransferase PlsX